MKTLELLDTRTTITGKVIRLYQTGKSFKLEIDYPASARIEAETVTKRYASHERALKAFIK